MKNLDHESVKNSQFASIRRPKGEIAATLVSASAVSALPDYAGDVITDIVLRAPDGPYLTPTPGLPPAAEARLGGRPAPHQETAESTGQSLPLSVAQRGIWVGQKIGRASIVFNLAESIEIPGPVNPDLFIRALRQLTREADVVRIKIVEGPDGPRQFVRDVVDYHFPYFDVSGEADPDRTARDWMMQELTRPVDFDRDPLWVSALFKAAPDRFFWYHRSHHIVLDGFAGGMVARRVAELYTAYCEARAPEPHQFGRLATLIEAESAYRSSDRFERDRAYWHDRLAGLPEALSLATKRVPGFGGLFRRTTHLSPASTARLHELAKQAAGSLPQILISLSAAFVYRMTGAADLVFGLPVTARPNGQLRRIPGMVANAVPIRLAMAPTLTLDALVQQVAATVRQALRHQQYRYEDLRRDLSLVGRDQQISWTGVNIEPFDYDLRFGGHRATTHNLSNGSVDDLTIFIYDRDDGRGLRIDFDANPALYTAEKLTELQTRFRRLVDAVLERPDVPLGQIDLLDPQERQQILAGWNETDQPEPAALLVDQIEAQIQATPEATALEFGSSLLTYRQLNAQANYWAHLLIEQGIGPGDLVALALPRSAILPVALLAVLKAGAAYLPIDPELPMARIELMLDDARPAIVLTAADIAPGLPERCPPCLLLDRPILAIDLARLAERNPRQADRSRALTPDTTAYVIFTSGSTGRPKGVMISQGSLSNFLAAMHNTLKLRRDDRLLAVTTISFDIAALEIFAPLVAGCCVVMASRAAVRDPAALGDLIQSAGITMMQATPSLWQALIDTNADAVQGLRVLVGGEALPGALAQALSERAAGVLNLYGPTETTIWSTLAALTEADLAVPPIGQPIRNTQAYVLDANLEPVPPEALGDLYLAGDGLADGYLNRPGLTAERFIANPFGPPGSCFYRTGDLARWRRDGLLEFGGRRDHQIKIRGFRIEAGDVEAALVQCAGVDRAVVTAWDGSGGAKRLVAYLVPAAGIMLDPAELRCELGKSLPDYMVPSAFIMLETLPLTANGKLDRRALPPPEQQALAGYVAPRTPTELKLAAIWAVELTVERIGIHDSFFDLGGDSLMAARMIVEIQAAFSIELSLAAIFEGSTIAELAAYLEGKADGDPLAVVLPLRSQGKAAPLFCIHPVLGLSWAYAGLARHIGAAHPIYGLQARGLRGAETLPLCLEDMADDYLEQIRLVQPQGPYHLLGWSMGGLVAFEIARQLRQEGEEIRFLGLMDAYPFVQNAVEHEPTEAELATSALRFLGYDPAMLGEAPLSIASVAAFLFSQYDVLSIPLVAQMCSENNGLIASITAVIKNNLALAQKFVPGRIDADMVFLRATEGKDAGLDRLIHHDGQAWQRHVGGELRDYPVACHHQDMLSPAALDIIGPLLSQHFARRVTTLEPLAVPCE